MVKIKVVTRTTYTIDLPIESFDDISESTMTIEESRRVRRIYQGLFKR